MDRNACWGVLALRCLYLTSRGLVSSRVQLQASSLTYTTMLESAQTN